MHHLWFVTASPTDEHVTEPFVHLHRSDAVLVVGDTSDGLAFEQVADEHVIHYEELL